MPEDCKPMFERAKRDGGRELPKGRESQKEEGCEGNVFAKGGRRGLGGEKKSRKEG